MQNQSQSAELKSIRKEPPAAPDQHSVGPHATPELTDAEKTPGCGVLPEPDDPNISPTG